MPSGRIYVLKRHEIENYLLEDNIISKVQGEIFGKQVSPEYVRNKFVSIAREISGEVFRDMLSYRLNLIYRPNEDFSLGKFMNGQPIFDDNGILRTDILEAFKEKINERTSYINNELSSRTEELAIVSLITKCKNELEQAVFGNGDGWRTLFPGKHLLEVYSKKEGLGKDPALQNSIIKELSMNQDRIPQELEDVIRTIADGGRFSI